MKKKLVALILAFVLVAAFDVGIMSVHAVTDYDTEAVNNGYVARIGEAEDGNYYESLNEALNASSNGEIITLITDVDMRSNDSNIKISKSYITLQGAEGKNINLYRTGSFIIEGIFTLKNLNLYVEKDGGYFINSKEYGIANCINCQFVLSGTLRLGAFYIQGGTFNFTNCRVNLGKYDEQSGKYMGILANSENPQEASLFWSNSANSNVKLTRFYADITNSPELCGFYFRNSGQIEMTDSEIISGDNAVIYRGTGRSSIKMSGKSRLESTQATAVFFDEVTNDTTVNISGTAQIVSQIKDGIYMGGNKCGFTLNMTENAYIGALQNGINVSKNGLSPVKIAIGDNSSIICSNEQSCAVLAGDNAITADINGNAVLNAGVPFGLNAENLYSVITVDDTVSMDSGVCSVAPKMGNGASIRVQDGSNGIRFTSSVNCQKISNAVDFGILLVKYSDLDKSGSDFTVHSMNKNNVIYGKISALADGGSGTEQNDDGTLSFRIVLTDLPEAELKTKFAVRAYAVYELNGTQVYVYSDFDETENVRSMGNVAYAALNDTVSQRDEANGYIHELKDGKWSRYTIAQYEIIKSTYGSVAEPIA